jgi:hypothetical protein
MVDEEIVVKLGIAIHRVFVSEGDETGLECFSERDWRTDTKKCKTDWQIKHMKSCKLCFIFLICYK